jgi:hypothetical protein
VIWSAAAAWSQGWPKRPPATSRVYTDPRLLDVAGALGALPDLPLEGPDTSTTQVREVLAG